MLAHTHNSSPWEIKTGDPTRVELNLVLKIQKKNKNWLQIFFIHKSSVSHNCSFYFTTIR